MGIVKIKKKEMNELTKLFDDPNTTLTDVNLWLLRNDSGNKYRNSPALKRAVNLHVELYEAKQEEQNLIKEKEIQELKARNENRRKSLKRTNVNSHNTPRDAAPTLDVNSSGDAQETASKNVAPKKKKIKTEKA